MIVGATTGRKCAVDRRGWKSVAGGLAMVAFLSIIVTGTSARVDTPSDQGECVRAPTPRCVVDLSLAAADTVSDPYRRARALARIAEAQVEFGEPAEALESLSRSLDAAAGITGPAYMGDIGIEALADIEAGRDKSLVLSNVATVLGGLGKTDKAKSTLAHAANVAERIWRDRYRAEGFVGIARAQLALGALDAARATLARADLARNTQYLPLFHKTVRKQAETGDVTGALLTAGAMPRGTERAQALAGIAAVQASTGNVASALVTAGNVQHSYFRMVAMHYIGCARARNGDIDGAWRAVEEIGAIWHEARDGLAGSRDTVILQADTIIAIADAHLAKGEFEKALAATEGIADDLAFGRIHAATAAAQMAAGNLEGALQSAKATCGGRRQDSRCVRVLAGLAITFAGAGHSANAGDTLAWARRAAKNTLLPDDRSLAFSILHATRMRLGDREGARREFSSGYAATNAVSDARERASSFAQLGLAAARAGNTDSATEAFSASVATASKLEDLGERVETLARTGLSQTLGQDRAGARMSFSRALVAAAAIESDGLRALVLASLAYAMASGEWPVHDDSL